MLMFNAQFSDGSKTKNLSLNTFYVNVQLWENVKNVLSKHSLNTFYVNVQHANSFIE